MWVDDLALEEAVEEALELLHKHARLGRRVQRQPIVDHNLCVATCHLGHLGHLAHFASDLHSRGDLVHAVGLACASDTGAAWSTRDSETEEDSTARQTCSKEREGTHTR